jgi:flagellar biogenesis protein FliO
MIVNSLITTISTALVVLSLGNISQANTEMMPNTEATAMAESVKKPQASATDLTNSKSAPREALGIVRIEAEVENDQTFVTAKLSKLPSWRDLEIEEHGTFLQIKMPGTTVINSGEFIDGTGPYLKKIASFQVGESDAALRLFINQDASKAKLATSVELVGERIVVTIDHKKLEQLITPAAKTVAASKALEASPLAGSESATKSTAEVSRSPQNGVANSIKSEPIVNVDSPSLLLRDKLITAAAFCAVMLLLLLGSTLYRNKRIKSKKASAEFASQSPAPMKILSHLNISPRQRLALVQVGSQQILIGVSPDQISFLTEVDQKPRQTFNAQLLNASPSAEIKLKQVDEPQNRPTRTVDPTSAPQKMAVRAKQIPVAKASTTGNRINVAVGDAEEQSSNIKRSLSQRSDKGHADQPFDDITKLIRDRLRNLPPAP